MRGKWKEELEGVKGRRRKRTTGRKAKMTRGDRGQRN
jgi:hypothetical protein